ncbi:MAG TPA: hypothetical protein PKL83_00620 [bacterium]|nr:hypothetical protein [bacterium]
MRALSSVKKGPSDLASTPGKQYFVSGNPVIRPAVSLCPADGCDGRTDCSFYSQHRYILCDRESGSYLLLGERELFIFRHLDGRHSMQDLVYEYFRKYERFAYDPILYFVKILAGMGFLESSSYKIFAREQSRQSWFDSMLNRFRRLLVWKIPLPHSDRLITFLFKAGAHRCFSSTAKWFYLFCSVIGVALFIRLFASGTLAQYQYTGEREGWFIIALLGLFALSLSLHELAHAFTCKHYGAHVKEAGMVLYAGFPMLYVNTTDIWTKSKRSRIFTSLAGVWIQMVLSGLALMAVVSIDAAWLRIVLIEFVFVNYLGVLFNLNPFLEMDGYYVLVDLVGVPNLRKKTGEFLRRGWMQKLKRGERLTRTDGWYIGYAVSHICWIIVLAVFASLYWQHHLELWRQIL